MAMEFEIRADESATQYALRTSPAFWVRVAEPTGFQLTLTNALQGDLSDDEFAATLAAILTRHVSGTISEIRIADTTPSLTADMNSRDFVGQRFDFLCMVVRGWAERNGRRVCDSRLDMRAGLHGALFKLE
jgi:hypothetical protein